VTPTDHDQSPPEPAVPLETPQIRVEFLGLARTRSGIDSIDIRTTTVAGLIAILSERLPALAELCFSGDGQIRAGWLLCLDGRQFTRDVAQELTDASTVLLLSADAGG